MRKEYTRCHGHGIEAFTYGVSFTPKRIYTDIHTHTHIYRQNLNPIEIKISNQCVCCYPIKKWNKKRSYEQKEKMKLFFTEKRKR